MSPPLGRSAASTTCQAVARSGMRDHGRNSRWTSRPWSAAAVAQPGEGRRRLVEGPRAPEDVDRVERACADRIGDGEQLGLGDSGRSARGRALAECGSRTRPEATTRQGRARRLTGHGRPAGAGCPGRPGLHHGRPDNPDPTAKGRRSGLPRPPPPSPGRRDAAGAFPSRAPCHPHPSSSVCPKVAEALVKTPLRTSVSGHYRSSRVRERYRAPPRRRPLCLGSSCSAPPSSTPTAPAPAARW